MFKKVHVIVNPASGHPQPILRTLNNVFHPADIDWNVSITRRSGDVRRFARDAATAGVDAVAIYGGDGSVMEAASGLMGSKVPLGILPGGTANCMANELGIPIPLDKACRLINSESSKVRTVDLGQSGDRYFALRIGAGHSAEEVKGADRNLKDKFGPMAYWISSIKALRQPTISHYLLDLDGEQVESEGLTCLIANSGNLGAPGLSFSSDIDVSDGLLDVLVIRNKDIDSVISLLNSVAGHQADTLSLPHWKAKEVTLVADPPQAVQGDGEIWGETPISARVVPEAVRVIVPGETMTNEPAKLPLRHA
jgi:diacylglycerol kinase (ATP)